jgi:hypothetical protein
MNDMFKETVLLIVVPCRWLSLATMKGCFMHKDDGIAKQKAKPRSVVPLKE